MSSLLLHLTCMHHWMQVQGHRTQKDTNMTRWAVLAYCHCIHALQQKKGRQTCWSFLLILLTLVALVELRKGLCCLLQPWHKDLDVIQGAVEDLLRETKPGVNLKNISLRDSERSCIIQTGVTVDKNDSQHPSLRAEPAFLVALCPSSRSLVSLHPNTKTLTWLNKTKSIYENKIWAV